MVDKILSLPKQLQFQRFFIVMLDLLDENLIEALGSLQGQLTEKDVDDGITYNNGCPSACNANCDATCYQASCVAWCSNGCSGNCEGACQNWCAFGPHGYTE